MRPERASPSSIMARPLKGRQRCAWLPPEGRERVAPEAQRSVKQMFYPVTLLQKVEKMQNAK